MRVVSRAVRAGALDRTEVPDRLLPELDRRRAQPAGLPPAVGAGRSMLPGLLVVASGVLWAGFVGYVCVTQGMPTRLSGNAALVAVVVLGGLEMTWAARRWRRERAAVRAVLRDEARAAIRELMRDEP